MQRPILNTLPGIDAPKGPPPKLTLTPRFVSAMLARVWRVVRWCVRCLLSKPLARHRSTFRVEEGTRLGRLCKGVAYRLLFVPMLTAIMAAAFVYTGTHPKQKPVDADPATTGLHFDPVSFTSRDGTRLSGWLVPAVTAKQVIEKREDVLRLKHPAVVLVHDFGRSPLQVLPYLGPLHEDGLVTLTVGLRGAGTPEGTRGQTFGLREAEDVAAAVEVLRRRPFVDGDRIAIMGVGTGANAAVRAASQDLGIRAVVLMDPVRDGAAVIAGRIGPQRAGMRWMQPICKWTFELCYRVDAEEISLDHYARTLETRPSLVIDRQAPLDKARVLLRTSLGVDNATASTN